MPKTTLKFASWARVGFIALTLLVSGAAAAQFFDSFDAVIEEGILPIPEVSPTPVPDGPVIQTTDSSVEPNPDDFYWTALAGGDFNDIIPDAVPQSWPMSSSDENALKVPSEYSAWEGGDDDENRPIEQFEPFLLQTSAISFDAGYHVPLFSDPLFGYGLANTKQWTRGLIPYEVDGTFTAEQQDLITKAIAKWNSLVGNFVQYIPKGPDNTDYVYFNKAADPMKCTSSVGMETGRQDLHLGDNCFRPGSKDVNQKLGSPLHEMMHAAGFKHEHQRPDRDNALTVNYDNLATDIRNNPALLDVTFNILADNVYKTYEKDTDLASIMMYGSYDFARKVIDTDGKEKFVGPVMTKKDGSTFSQNTDFSPADIKALQTMYASPKEVMGFIGPSGPNGSLLTGTRAKGVALCAQYNYVLPTTSYLRQRLPDVLKYLNANEPDKGACVWTSNINRAAAQANNPYQNYVYPLFNDQNLNGPVLVKDDYACTILCLRPLPAAVVAAAPKLSLRFSPYSVPNGTTVKIMVVLELSPAQYAENQTVFLKGYLDGVADKEVALDANNPTYETLLDIRNGAPSVPVYTARVKPCVALANGSAQCLDEVMARDQVYIDPTPLGRPTCTLSIDPKEVAVFQDPNRSYLQYVTPPTLSMKVTVPPGMELIEASMTSSGWFYSKNQVLAYKFTPADITALQGSVKAESQNGYDMDIVRDALNPPSYLPVEMKGSAQVRWIGNPAATFSPTCTLGVKVVQKDPPKQE